MSRRKQIMNQPLGGGAGGGGPYPSAYVVPIVSNYAPTTSDQGDALGQIWVYSNGTSSQSYVLVNQQSGVSTWVTNSGASGAGTFTSITNSGSTTLSSLGRGVVESDNTGLLSSQALTNGQVIIGSTGAQPVASTLTAGTGVSISNGPGTITISSSAFGSTWSSKAANFSASVGNGYVITAGSGAVTATMPTVGALGDTVEILYPSATAGDILAVTATASKLRMAGDATARTTYTWPANNLSGAANPSVTLVCVVASATVPAWQLTEVDGNPVGS